MYKALSATFFTCEISVNEGTISITNSWLLHNLNNFFNVVPPINYVLPLPQHNSASKKAQILSSLLSSLYLANAIAFAKRAL